MYITRKRTIAVSAYEFPIEQTNAPTNMRKINLGRINGIYSAVITVTNFGDPIPTVVCEMNDNNMELIQAENLIRVRYNEVSSLDGTFIINYVSYNTTAKTITFTAEPEFNTVRNGVYAINEVHATPDGGSRLRMYQLPDYVFHTSPKDRYPNAYVRGELLKANMINTARVNYLQVKPYGKTMLELIGGSENSLADMFGGEFDKTTSIPNSPTVTHHTALGRPNLNMVLSTSVQVSGIEYTIDSTNLLNGVVHIFTYNTDSGVEGVQQTNTIYIKDTDNTASNYRQKLHELTSKIADKESRIGSVIIKDWGGESESSLGDPIKDGKAHVRNNLIKQANIWNAANKNRSMPVETIKFDFDSIRGDQGLQELSHLLALQLGDSVKVHVKELNRTITGRVSGYTYNILTDTYDKMTIGSSLRTIIDKIN